ncbi:MAG: glyoxalase [Mucilaginibacter sp.]|nr:glyoxalase [Mucilaginibacter sp.]
MLRTNFYLHFMGNTEEAMNFYKSVFGGEFESFMRYSDVPGGEKMQAYSQKKIMHAALPISGGQMIMATDTLESMERSVVFGNNYYISLEAENEAEVDKIFAALSAGGTIEVPLNKTFWGAYFGMFADKFGVQWMINYTYPKKS